MIRRTVFGVLAAPLLTGQAFAQRTQAQPGTARAVPLDTDRRHMLGTMAFATASSTLARSEASAAPVKLFGELEAEEQMAFVSARRMAGLPLPDPSMMDAEQRQMLTMLHSARGTAFDTAFIRGQIQGHQELLRLHMAAAAAPVSREEGMLATVAVPAIRSHLAMLTGIAAAT
ncbi:MAG: hypothetical protein JWO26_2292 [Rhodospirillales bacterium]|nr:hypothetical protein [Rhodospirillales bacterium]